MPYKLSKSGSTVYYKAGGRWRVKKRFTGRRARDRARRYAIALNLAHARKRGYKVPAVRRRR